MLEKRLQSILPTPTAEESFETTRIYSSLGQMRQGQPLMALRPFRSPYLTICNPVYLVVAKPDCRDTANIASYHSQLLLLFITRSLAICLTELGKP
ncbi:MAG: ATP-binding protein [Pirellulales bacterium]